METWTEFIGREAYEAYGRWVKWNNFQGNPMPQWHELPTKISDAWCNAALRVYQLTEDQNKKQEKQK